VALSKLLIEDDQAFGHSLATIVEFSLEDDLSKTKFPKLVLHHIYDYFLLSIVGYFTFVLF